MRIKATYIDDSFQVEADEQRMIIPRPFFSRFVSVVESAYYRYTRSLKEAKKAQYEELKAKIGAAGHPDILPSSRKTQSRHQRSDRRAGRRAYTRPRSLSQSLHQRKRQRHRHSSIRHSGKRIGKDNKLRRSCLQI